MTKPTLRARRDMVMNAQYPEAWMPMPFLRRFTASERERMSLGFVPEDMDDKWFIYLEDDTFYFHRDSTGRCIFRMQLHEVREGFEVSEAAVALYPPPSRPWWRLWHNNLDNPPRTTDAALVEEMDLLTLLIEVALLGKADTRVPPTACRGSEWMERVTDEQYTP